MGSGGRPSLRFATPPFAFRPEFLARLTVQAFSIGLIRARLRGCLFICGAGHRGGCRRRWSLRRRDGGGDDERQDSRAKCHRSHGASSLNKRDEAGRFIRSPRRRWRAASADSRQAVALFFIAPTIAVSMAPPAPPAIACEMIPPTLRLPDCAAAVIAGSSKVTIWPSTPPPIKPEIMLPIIPRSKVGDDLPTATPPSAPVTRLIKICSMLISQPFDQPQDYPAMTWVSSFLRT